MIAELKIHVMVCENLKKIKKLKRIFFCSCFFWGGKGTKTLKVIKKMDIGILQLLWDKNEKLNMGGGLKKSLAQK